MKKLTIPRLVSGGVITNYFCTSKCRHCLYNSGPEREKAYLEPTMAGEIFDRIRQMGCTSVHIGGGEPMLRTGKLAGVIETAREKRIGIAYVETNASWFKGMAPAVETLSAMRERGLTALLVSISPFHNEFIPFSRVKGVMRACRETGIRVFPWIEEFIHDLSALDTSRPHPIEEHIEKFGGHYPRRILKRYWLHPGGRALDFIRPLMPTRTLPQILEENAGNCSAELSDTTHFHIDLFGNYIPGLCSGLAAAMEVLGSPLPPERYPLMTALADSGIRGLYSLAREVAGFEPSQPEYLNKCDLCTDIRSFLVGGGLNDSEELRPEAFYFGWESHRVPRGCAG